MLRTQMCNSLTDPSLTEIDLYVISVVKSKREAAGYSQQQLADLLGVTRGFIGSIENPKRRAKYNIATINQLAIIFDCSPKDFFPEHYFDSEL